MQRRAVVRVDRAVEHTTRVQAGNHPQDGRLTDTRWAQQAGPLAAFKRQVQIIEERLVAVAEAPAEPYPAASLGLSHPMISACD